jgi:DNA adenine methylase
VLIRYPGSKDRATDKILRLLDLSDRRICEPFAGTAAVTYDAIAAGLVDAVHINDIDDYIADLHLTIRDDHEALIERVWAYQPAAQDFYDYKEVSGNRLLNAFHTIVLHQISFSGLGRKAGSPIGGKKQTGKYPVNCRWHAGRLTGEIKRLHGLLTSVDAHITSGDWASCPPWAWFVDPPYFKQGEGLYRLGGMDHTALRNHLRDKAEPWVLTYDDDPEVRSMYDWAHIPKKGGLETYLNHGAPRDEYRKRELMITPRPPDYDEALSGWV